MPQVRQTIPRVDELWLSRPPYLLIARIVEVEAHGPESGVVSYKLYDEAGSVLEHVNHAELDEGWWQTFQPLSPRQG